MKVINNASRLYLASLPEKSGVACGFAVLLFEHSWGGNWMFSIWKEGVLFVLEVLEGRVVFFLRWTYLYFTCRNIFNVCM